MYSDSLSVTERVHLFFFYIFVNFQDEQLSPKIYCTKEEIRHMAVSSLVEGLSLN